MSEETVTLLVCRAGFEAELQEELALRAGGAAVGVPAGGGLLAVHDACPTPALIFERQRIEDARRFDAGSLKSMARELLREVMGPVIRSDHPWVAHVFAAGEEDGESLSARARNLERVFLELCAERFRHVAARRRAPGELARDADALVLNVCLAPGALWAAVMPLGRLSDPRPGGVHRMAFDAEAPARSYLKLEEAFDMLDERPEPGQTVIDLGASPGGWSWSCLKRGCRVTAVDNGAMRIRQPERFGGILEHRRENGVTFEPDAAEVPVDWLVSDMLITAGTNIGMLRKWFLNGWMRRFVVNIKIPQAHAYPVLLPVETFLDGVPGIAYAMRHLYHDRREVTLYGRLRQAGGGGRA